MGGAPEIAVKRKPKTTAISKTKVPVNKGTVAGGPAVAGRPMPIPVLRGRMGIQGKESHRALAKQARVRARMASTFP